MHKSKTEGGGYAVSFPWLADNAFVTEFYDKKHNLITFWDAPAVYEDEARLRYDKEALHAFHEANVAIWAEDGGPLNGSIPQEEEGT